MIRIEINSYYACILVQQNILYQVFNFLAIFTGARSVQ